MHQEIIEQALEQLKLRLLENDWDGDAEVIEALCPADQADLFSELEPITQEALLPQLEVEDAADILEKLEDPEAAKLAQG